MKKTAFALLILMQVVIITRILGQTPQENYMRKAGLNAALYRGPIQKRFMFRYNGTFYAFSSKFLSGEIWYNAKYYSGVVLNLDAYEDELCIAADNGTFAIILDKDQVEKFSFDNKNFIHVTPRMNIRNLPSGYYQLLYGGKDTLLKKIRQRYVEKTEQVDEKGVFRYFEKAVTYHLIRDGISYTVFKESSFPKIYKEKKKELKVFIKKHFPVYAAKSEGDNNFISIMKFIEGN